jgi:hypothetical protein
MSNIIVSALKSDYDGFNGATFRKKKRLGFFFVFKKKARGPAEMEGARRSCTYALRLG